MKKTLSLILALCLILSLTSVAALAAEGDPAEEVPAAAVTEEMTAEEPAEEAAEPGEKKSDLKSVFRSELYVKADEDAGLAGDIKVDLDLLGSIGTLYLPGKVDASKLNFFWDDDTITVSRDGTVYESGTAPVAEPGKSITYKIKKNLAFALLTVKTVQGSPDVEPLYLELDESLGTIDAMNSDKAHETSCYGKAIFDGKKMVHRGKPLRRHPAAQQDRHGSGQIPGHRTGCPVRGHLDERGISGQLSHDPEKRLCRTEGRLRAGK